MRPTAHIAKCMYNGYTTVDIAVVKKEAEPEEPAPAVFAVGGVFDYSGGFETIEISGFTPAIVSKMKVDLISSCGIEKIYNLNYKIGENWHAAEFYSMVEGQELTNIFVVQQEHSGEQVESFSIVLNGGVEPGCDIPLLVK